MWMLFPLCREIFWDVFIQRVHCHQTSHELSRGICQPQQEIPITDLPQWNEGGLQQLQPTGPLELWLSNGWVCPLCSEKGGRCVTCILSEVQVLILCIYLHTSIRVSLYFKDTYIMFISGRVHYQSEYQTQILWMYRFFDKCCVINYSGLELSNPRLDDGPIQWIFSS